MSTTASATSCSKAWAGKEYVRALPTTRVLTVAQGSLKEDRGLAEPIQVKVRPKNQGLSYDNFNERTDQSLRHFEDLDEVREDAMDTEEVVDETAREQHWKRSAPKRKTVYKTVEEVMGGKAQSAQQIIVDMRGPQVKVLSGASQISQRDIITRSSFLPELRSNVALLVDMREGQLHSIDQRRRYVRASVRAHTHLTADTRRTC